MKLILSVLTSALLMSTFSARASTLTDLSPIRLIQNISENAELPLPANDSDLVRANRDRHDVDFVQGNGVKVTQILPDDTQGLQHERWYIQLSDGSVVFAVYNIDMNVDRVPLQVGQIQAIGGQFKWTANGGLIHWLHDDPANRRPDGFVVVDGHRYGEIK